MPADVREPQEASCCWPVPATTAAAGSGAELAADGVDVTVVATGPRIHEGGLSAALAAGAHLASVTPGGVALLAARVDVVVDAIVGTGTSPNPALRGAAREIVAAILPNVSAPDAPAIIGPVHLSPCATSTLASGNLRAELNIGSSPPVASSRILCKKLS